MRAQEAPPASIVDAGRGLRSGNFSSRELIEYFHERIERFDGLLAATLSVNESALDEADRLDRERREGRVRSPLHGVPVAVKDNIQTAGMPTTGGTVAFRRLRAETEALVVSTLREAGAIVLAKTTMTEAANWMSSSMPDGYNALRGFSLNPYDPRTSWVDGEQRPASSPGGSSSGVGTAAGLWLANIGTETSGSILSPSIACMLVGVKPTLGRISTEGVMPIAAEQDVVGPMAVCVEDAATLPRTLDPTRGRRTEFAQLGHDLRGARVGVPRAYFREPMATAWDGATHGGLPDAEAQLFGDVIAEPRRAGAEMLEDVEIPSVIDPRRDRPGGSWRLLSFSSWAGVQLGPTTKSTTIDRRTPHGRAIRTRRHRGLTNTEEPNGTPCSDESAQTHPGSSRLLVGRAGAPHSSLVESGLGTGVRSAGIARRAEARDSIHGTAEPGLRPAVSRL